MSTNAPPTITTPQIPLQTLPTPTQTQARRRRSQQPTLPTHAIPPLPSAALPAQQQGIVASAGIWIWHNFVALFASIAAAAGLIGTWWAWFYAGVANQMAETANQLARAAGILALVQFCQEYSGTEDGRILCAARRDVDSVVKEFSVPTAEPRQSLAQVAARSMEYTSAAVVNHNTMCNRAFRLVLNMSSLSVHGLAILPSKLQSSTSRVHTSMRRYFVYIMAAIMVLQPSIALSSLTSDYFICAILFILAATEKYQPIYKPKGVDKWTAFWLSFFSIFLFHILCWMHSSYQAGFRIGTSYFPVVKELRFYRLAAACWNY